MIGVCSWFLLLRLLVSTHRSLVLATELDLGHALFVLALVLGPLLGSHVVLLP